MEFYVQPGKKMCDTIIKQRVMQTHFLIKYLCVYFTHQIMQAGLMNIVFTTLQTTVLCEGTPGSLWFLSTTLVNHVSSLYSKSFSQQRNLFTKVTRRRHTMCLTKISYLQVYHLLNEYTEKSSLLVKGLVSISF